LQGRLISADALHTQTDTARQIVMEKGGDYLLTVKDNQPTLNQNITQLIPAPEAGFSPSKADPTHGPNGGME
jgi:predicted transposase YbfD/YdcC